MVWREQGGLKKKHTHNSSLPEWPLAWYVVARSVDIKPGALISGKLAEHAYVIYRTAQGSLQALDAHCPHMGAHLGYGRVRGENLQCALHHWQIDPEGCVHPQDIAAFQRRARVWPVQEQYGLVFLHPPAMAKQKLAPPPALMQAQKLRWTTSRPIELDANWQSMVVNGFDMLHLNAVHKRELYEPANIKTIAGKRLELSYRSRVTGQALSDRMMRWIASNNIKVHQACSGPVVIVQSDLGRTRTAAVLGILKLTDGRVRAFGAFGVPPGFASSIRLKIARYLFAAFLKRDFEVVQGMRLRTDVDDPGVQALVKFLRGLKTIVPLET